MNAIATVLLDDLPPGALDRLPEEAVAKIAQLRALRDDSRDLYEAANAAFMRLRDPGNDLVRAERELALLTEAPIGAIVDGLKAERVKPDKQQTALDRNMERFNALEARVDALRAQHDQARQLRDQRGKVSLQHIGLYERVTDWVKANAHAPFTLAAPVDFSKISDPHNELNQTRTLIASLVTEERRLLNIGIPLVQVEQRIAAYVDAMASSVQFGGLLDRDSRPSPLLPEDNPEVALLCWLQPKEMVRRLLAEAKDRSDFKHALTDVEWAEQRAALANRLFEAELREEAVIAALAQQGTAILRRTDASPRAVLQLASGHERRRRATK